MTATLYLIAHKVRGEPAFDIAINIGDETGDLWIIPTSGHRAYPYWHEDLAVLAHHDLVRGLPPMPADWPDHYPIMESVAAPAKRASVSPKPTIPNLEDI